ncbi:MAG: autotransporter domain-containing protein [Chlamydiales bacterium]|nr:autotransporter domain-containing protein [Chlamydiales bacterium]
MRRFICSILLALPFVLEASFQVLIPVSYYGWLDQYSMDSGHSFVGNEACVPTSSVNSFTYLQSSSPSIFGTGLSGTSYSNWEDTDDAMISIMGTTTPDGTYYYQFVWTYNMYMALTKNHPEVQFSGMFPDSIWDASLGYPKPDYITSGKPTAQFLTNLLASGSVALTSIEYTGGGGHELLVNGLEWDPTTNTGTLYFVDPLDPSQNYSGSTVLGPVKQTSGTLQLNGDGNLLLTYDQYSGRLPYTGTYDSVSAELVGLLSVGGFFYNTSYIGNANAQAIVEGVRHLDPTTSSITPILAVLNTVADAESAFLELDPSLYNALLFTDQNVSREMQTAINGSLRRYRYCCTAPGCCRNLWITPLELWLHQDSIDRASYSNRIDGGIIGYDMRLTNNCIGGAAFSYAHTKISWKNTPASAHLNSYGLSLYAAKYCHRLSFDTSLTGFFNHASGSRTVYIPSALPFIAPIDTTITHKNCSNTLQGHVGAIYDLCHWNVCRSTVNI